MTPVDPFDLPEWLGTTEITWYAGELERGGHHLRGELRAEAGTHPCDLLAIDQAWPTVVAPDHLREEVHLQWRLGEVSLVEVEGRLTALAPGSWFSAARVLAVLERVARAVGARPDRFVAAIRLGSLREE